jgi:hypothetical protein
MRWTTTERREPLVPDSFDSPSASSDFFGKDDLQLSESERVLTDKILRPEAWLLSSQTDRLLGYIAERLAMGLLNIPLNQIAGFTSFKPYIATRVDTAQTTSSTSYTNLSTVGPELAGLPDGTYFVVYGASISTDTGDNGYYSPKINSTEAVDGNAVFKSASPRTEITGTLDAVIRGTDNDNTITMRYRVANGAAVATFQFRWLYAIRYA